MNNSKTTKAAHRHRDPAFPVAARELLERIASTLERIADAQERRAFNQEAGNAFLGNMLKSVVPALISQIVNTPQSANERKPQPVETAEKSVNNKGSE
jgi:hypothetical protein